jgi:hypothetical protein
MTTLQQALIDAKLAKDQTTKSSIKENNHIQESELPTLGTNDLGNRQYYLGCESVCPNCLERYKNVSLGDECDICQFKYKDYVISISTAGRSQGACQNEVHVFDKEGEYLVKEGFHTVEEAIKHINVVFNSKDILQNF